MRIFVAIGSLLVVLLSVVLIAPFFVDWTAFRADFEREASRILGQPVRVLGEAEARLLPFPSLRFTDIVVGEPDAEPTMTLERFRLDAELAPYLSGEIRIVEMRLEGPHLRVPVAVDGGSPALPTLPDSSGSTVVLENVVVVGGRISLQNAETGRSREFTDIDAELSAQTLGGPFAGGGRLNANGERLSFNLASGRIEADGRWPLRLTLGSERLGADFVFDGATALGDGELDFAGRFDLTSRPPVEGSGSAALLPPVRVASDIEISRRTAELSTLRAEIGDAEMPYVLSGEGSFDIADIPHFELTLRGEQVDVDRLAGETQETAGTRSFTERAEAVRTTLAAIPRIDVPGRINLTLPIVTAGDTVIRDLSFTGSPSEGGWTIRDFSAELPGRTLLEASGILTVREDLAFSGDLLVAARQPARFASWLTGSAAPEIAALSRAGFSARTLLSAGTQRFEDLEVDVGGQRLIGRLERGGQNGALSLSADLAGEAVDLDGFAAFARLFTGNAALDPVERLDIRFDAGPVAYDGMTADALGFDFSFEDDFLDLRNLIARNLAGADLDARGTVAGLRSEPRPDLAAEMTSEAPERFLALLGERVPGLPPLGEYAERVAAMAPLALSSTATTSLDEASAAIAVAVGGTAGGSRIDLSATVEEGLAALDLGGPFGVEITVANDAPAELLRQLGLEGLDLGLPAPLSLTAFLRGDGAAPMHLTGEASAPGSTVGAQGTLLVGSGEESDLSLTVASDNASPWLTAAGAAFGQGFDALPLDLAARLAFADGGWSLEGLSGTVADTPVEASLDADAGASVTGDVRLGELSLPWLTTLVYAASPQVASGDRLWPQTPFGEALLAPRNFSVDVETESLRLGEDTTLGVFAARLEGGGDRLRLADFSASLGTGRLTGDAEMSNTAGFGGVRLDLALADAELQNGAIPLEGRLSGSLTVEGSGRNFAELVGSLTGEGVAQLDGAMARGIAADRLPAILAASDAEGFEPASGPVETLVEAQDENAAYPIGDLRSPVAVALGTARILPVTADRGAERLSGQGAIDLRSGTAEASLTVAFRPLEDDRIDDTAPSITYELGADSSAFELASVEPLTSFLSLRAYAREQERLEALREELRETIRLRREARLYRSRAAEREAERLAAEEAERLRLQAEEEERRRVEAERLAAEEAVEAERVAAEEARAAEERAAEAARQAVQNAPLRPSAPPPASSQALDFDLTPPEAIPQPPSGYEGLPGVAPPTDF